MKSNVSELSDDALLDEYVYWIKVYRNESVLHGDERQYFKKLTTEVAKRQLLRGSGRK